MKISISTCAFNGLYKTPIDLVEACYKTKFRHIDLSFTNFIDDENFIENVKACADKAKEYDIDFPMAHAPYKFNPNVDDENFEKQINHMKLAFEACSILGIDRMTVHAGFAFSETMEEMMQKNVKYYNAIIPFAEKYNVFIMLENIAEEIYKRKFVIENADNILELKKMLNDHPMIKVCWDTGHANVKSLDQYDNIIKFKGNLMGLHLQDNNGYNDDHMPILMGTVNFDEVIKALLDIDYDGPFNMETQLFNPGNEWPNYRHKITEQSGAQPILFDPDEELRYLSLDIMYKLAEYALKKYNIQVE